MSDTKIDATVRKTRVRGLSLISAGAIPPNPSELLGSAKFTRLVQGMREKFDWIVFDTPPVLPITDSLVAAKTVGNVLFVVAADSTSRRVAADALEQLSHSGAQVVGVVLNKANLRRHPYYYSRYYRRSYDRYYHRETRAS